MTTKISVRNVGKVFSVKGGEFQAVRDVNLEVAPEEFVCIVGPSGCGKSTLLRMLGGLETATTGEIKLEHQHAEPSDHDDDLPAGVGVSLAHGREERRLRPACRPTPGRARKAQERVDYFLEKTGLRRSANSIPTSSPAA